MVQHAQMFMQAAQEVGAAADVLVMPQWSDSNWMALLGRMRHRHVHANEIVVARGSKERALFFTAAGEFEVGGAYVGGVSLNWLARITPGSVFGEQSFFDGLPRSANVWAHAEADVLVLSFEDYLEFANDQPELARDLLFALARILSLRLRSTTVRVH